MFAAQAFATDLAATSSPRALTCNLCFASRLPATQRRPETGLGECCCNAFALIHRCGRVGIRRWHVRSRFTLLPTLFRTSCSAARRVAHSIRLEHPRAFQTSRFPHALSLFASGFPEVRARRAWEARLAIKRDGEEGQRKRRRERAGVGDKAIRVE